MSLVSASRKPSVGAYPEWGRAGLLMSYSSDIFDGVRHAGIYVAKILMVPSPAIPRRAGEQVYVRHQPQDRESARHRRALEIAGARR